MWQYWNLIVALKYQKELYILTCCILYAYYLLHVTYLEHCCPSRRLRQADVDALLEPAPDGRVQGPRNVCRPCNWGRMQFSQVIYFSNRTWWSLTFLDLLCYTNGMRPMLPHIQVNSAWKITQHKNAVAVVANALHLHKELGLHPLCRIVLSWNHSLRCINRTKQWTKITTVKENIADFSAKT